MSTTEIRYNWIVNNPQSARHLLNLLDQGKGDIKAFESMIDRIILSAQNAKVKNNER